MKNINRPSVKHTFHVIYYELFAFYKLFLSSLTPFVLNSDYFHVCSCYLLFFFTAPDLVTPRLHGIGDNQLSNDMWTFGHAATMAPSDRCIQPITHHHSSRHRGAFDLLCIAKKDPEDRHIPF